MSKSIRSYPQGERRSVIARRIERKTSGLGYWAAVNAQKHQGQVKKVEVVKTELEIEIETNPPDSIARLDN